MQLDNDTASTVAAPARQIGFEPFDPSRAGVYGDDAWCEESRSIEVRLHAMPPDD